jgi:Fe-S cluster assembly ATPase SufC
VIFNVYISHSRCYNEVESGLPKSRVLTRDGDEQVLESDMAILDEIDSGLDIDALRDVATAVLGLKQDNNAILMITHYRRLLDYVTPTFVHIMVRLIST